MTRRIREAVNARLKAEVIRDVLVEQINYYSKDGVRKWNSGGPSFRPALSRGRQKETALRLRAGRFPPLAG